MVLCIFLEHSLILSHNEVTTLPCNSARCFLIAAAASMVEFNGEDVGEG